jgi:hypothetical protein
VPADAVRAASVDLAPGIELLRIAELRRSGHLPAGVPEARDWDW